MKAETKSTTTLWHFVPKVAFAALFLACAPAWAQVAPNLGTSGPFTVLGANNVVPIVGTVTCTEVGAPPSGITGQVGTTFNGGIVNTGCTITGPIVSPVAAGVEADFTAALANIDIQNPVCGGVIPIVTTTLPPGVYCSNAGTTIGAGVILTLNGGPADIWVFRVGIIGPPSALTLNSAQIVMAGGASECNVYWKTSADMTATDSIFAGTVLSGGAATMTRGSWIGRMMARTDATLTDPTPMTGCAAAAAANARIPTLSQWALILLAGLLAITGFVAMRRRVR